MLESFYNTLGFAGALLTSFLIFIFFIFWMAGLAGMFLREEDDQIKTIRMTLAVLVPIYPFLWMIWDMIVQKRGISS